MLLLKIVMNQTSDEWYTICIDRCLFIIIVIKIKKVEFVTYFLREISKLLFTTPIMPKNRSNLILVNKIFWLTKFQNKNFDIIIRILLNSVYSLDLITIKKRFYKKIDMLNKIIHATKIPSKKHDKKKRKNIFNLLLFISGIIRKNKPSF